MRAIFLLIIAALLLIILRNHETAKPGECVADESRLHHFVAGSYQLLKFTAVDAAADKQIREWTAKREAKESAETIREH